MGADPRRPKRNATLSGYGPQRCSHRSGCSVGADPRRSPKITQDADLGHVVLLGAGLLALLCKFSHLHALPSIKREQDEREDLSCAFNGSCLNAGVRGHVRPLS